MSRRQKESLRPLTADERAELEHVGRAGSERADRVARAKALLVWPMGREVNPPHLDGVAVAVVNAGGFLGAALTQGPIGAVLDARWAGAWADGARRYPLEAYRDAFAICATFTAAAALLSMLMRETRGRNIYTVLRTAHDA